MAIITDFTTGYRIHLHGDKTDDCLVRGRYANTPGLRLDRVGFSSENSPEAIGFLHGATLASLNLADLSPFIYL